MRKNNKTLDTHSINLQRGFFRFFGYIIVIIVVLLALSFDFGNIGIVDKTLELWDAFIEKLRPVWNFLDPYWSKVEPYWDRFIWTPWKEVVEPFLIEHIGQPILTWLKELFTTT